MPDPIDTPAPGGHVDRIMYVCTGCSDHNSERCGHWDRRELAVTPDGRWLCESCLSTELSEDEANNLRCPPEYGPIAEAPTLEEMASRVATAVEGECDGLAITPAQAAEIVAWALTDMEPGPERDAKLAAILARLGSGDRDGWRDIASAPRDGTPILIYLPKNERQLVKEALWARDYEGYLGYWTTPHGVSGRGYYIPPESPTHWRPFPTPPASPIAEGEVSRG